jgi:hypothetical protein
MEGPSRAFHRSGLQSDSGVWTFEKDLSDGSPVITGTLKALITNDATGASVELNASGRTETRRSFAGRSLLFGEARPPRALPSS